MTNEKLIKALTISDEIKANELKLKSLENAVIKIDGGKGNMSFELSPEEATVVSSVLKVIFLESLSDAKKRFEDL